MSEISDLAAIDPRANIGANVRIGPFCVIGPDVTIGNGCVLMNNVTIDGVTRIGDGSLFMAYAHVAHDCLVGDKIIFANAATLAGHVEVGDHASVGAYSGVHQFCRVARYAFIGGYSVVTQDALPWVITVGNRAKTYGLNTVGIKRQGYSEETIDAIKRCYKLLFRSKMKLGEALEAAEAELGHSEEARYFIEFVRTSKRGICR